MLLPVFLGVFLTSCYLLPVAESRQFFKNAQVDNLQGSSEGIDNGVVEQSENMSNMFTNDSRSKFGYTLSSLSRYLPISVEYARTVGKNCDIVNNNKPFYTTISLIVSAVLIVLGIIFGFFGKLCVWGKEVGRLCVFNL